MNQNHKIFLADDRRALTIQFAEVEPTTCDLDHLLDVTVEYDLEGGVVSVSVPRPLVTTALRLYAEWMAFGDVRRRADYVNMVRDQLRLHEKQVCPYEVIR